MNEALTIKTERVDDIPLLFAQIQRMGLVELLDRHFPRHGNREGLSLGWVTALWLTHVHAPADHRINRVQSWAEQRLETLRGCSDARLKGRDLGDDQLADVLRDLSDDRRGGIRAGTDRTVGEGVRGGSQLCAPGQYNRQQLRSGSEEGLLHGGAARIIDRTCRNSK